MTALKIFFVITVFLIISAHAGSVFLREKIAKILGYINICLHIVLFFELLALRASIEFLALMLMLSLLVYLSLSFAYYNIKGKEKEKDDL